MTMKKLLLILALALPLAAQEPNYAEWNRILKTYYDPAHGMDYAALKAKDASALQNLRQQLAYWINVYNVNSVATVVEGYPVASIRDLSTDLLIRLNVFKKERVPVGNTTISLDDVENKKIREVFHDPRIHFAINCSAKSCPPIRTEAYVGANVDAQLDDQARRFLNGPLGVRLAQDGDELDIHVTKIMDWFGDDFQTFPGGRLGFLKKYISADKLRTLNAAREIDWEYDDYDWALNDWKR